MRGFALFIVYSFIGCLLESGFTWARTGRPAVRRAVLFLPLCPVYGLGGLALHATMTPLRPYPWAVFLLGGLLASAVEYGYAAVSERVFRVYQWNYGDLRGSLRGRVNIIFSLAWGNLALVQLYLLHPIVERAARAVPTTFWGIIALVFACDAAMTLRELYRFGRGYGRSARCPPWEQVR